MAIDFPVERWQKIKEESRLWWAGKLKRPLIQVVLNGAPPDRPEPKANSPDKNKTVYDLSITSEELIDRWDYELSGRRWLGDGLPHVFVDFGPGVIAALLGARPEPRMESVWFQAVKDQPIADVQLRYDPDNVWFRRLKDIYRAGIDRWQGRALMSMTDLGGNLDILSSFRPGEGLLLDLYDHPEVVKRLTWQAHHLWWRYFDEFNAILQPVNPGYSAWASLYSDVPFYMLQCDFCYMLGPEMFDEFVLPELTATCKRLGNAFYHLDGVGQLAHLDKLLKIPELKGIQWVPGAGKPVQADWPEVLRKVRDAGKLIQLGGNFATMDKLVRDLGSPEGILLICHAKIDQQPQYEECLRKYGAT